MRAEYRWLNVASDEAVQTVMIQASAFGRLSIDMLLDIDNVRQRQATSLLSTMSWTCNDGADVLIIGESDRRHAMLSGARLAKLSRDGLAAPQHK